MESSGIYLVHLATSNGLGHCTWLLGICAWIGGDTSSRIEGKVAVPDSRPDHYNVELGRDSTPTLPVFLIS